MVWEAKEETHSSEGSGISRVWGVIVPAADHRLRVSLVVDPDLDPLGAVQADGIRLALDEEDLRPAVVEPAPARAGLARSLVPVDLELDVLGVVPGVALFPESRDESVAAEVLFEAQEVLALLRGEEELHLLEPLHVLLGESRRIRLGGREAGGQEDEKRQRRGETCGTHRRET